MATGGTDELLMDTETNIQSSTETADAHLEIIAQPHFLSRLRYRSDYQNNKQRRGTLQSLNNPNYTFPTIRIAPQYLTAEPPYYIRVCLVTVINEKLSAHYIHPYDLEDIDAEERNDRLNKAIWYPITAEDITGMKSFPHLRIVKKRADELIRHGNLYSLDRTQSISQLSLPKDTIRQFNLYQSQLAFTIGYKINNDERYPSMILSETTVFSEIMVENLRKEHDEQVQSPTNSPTTTDRLPSQTLIHKYAPKSGSVRGGEEILVSFQDKLRIKRLGEIQIKFNCLLTSSDWPAMPIHSEVHGEIISFQAPPFPIPINEPTEVEITIQQKKRNLGTITYTYLPVDSFSIVCPTCQTSLHSSTKNSLPTTANDNFLSNMDLFPVMEPPPASILPANTPNTMMEPYIQ